MAVPSHLQKERSLHGRGPRATLVSNGAAVGRDLFCLQNIPRVSPLSGNSVLVFLWGLSPHSVEREARNPGLPGCPILDSCGQLRWASVSGRVSEKASRSFSPPPMRSLSWWNVATAGERLPGNEAKWGKARLTQEKRTGEAPGSSHT